MDTLDSLPHQLLANGVPPREIRACIWTSFKHSGEEMPIEVLISCAPGTSDDAALPVLRFAPATVFDETQRSERRLEAALGKLQWPYSKGHVSRLGGARIGFFYSPVGETFVKAAIRMSRSGLSEFSVADVLEAGRICAECLYAHGEPHVDGCDGTTVDLDMRTARLRGGLARTVLANGGERRRKARERSAEYVGEW